MTEFSPKYQGILDSLEADPSLVIENLLAEDDTTFSDLEKAQRAYVLSDAYVFLEYPVEALLYATQALELVSLSTQPWLFHSLNIRKAEALVRNELAAQGMGLVNGALAWAEANHDSALTADALFVKGVILLELQDYSGALKYLLKTYEIEETTTNITMNKAGTAGAIAKVYSARGDYKLAIPYFEESLKATRNENNLVGASISLYGLGGAYKNLGDLQKALNLYQESALLSRQVADVQGVAYAQNELANINIELGLYAEAERQLLEALDTFVQSDNTALQIRTHVSLVNLYRGTTQFDLAQGHMKSAKKILIPESMKPEWANVAVAEARLMAATGEHHKAYDLLAETMVK